MCKAIETITFCSCEENLDLSKSDADLNYIWILERVESIKSIKLVGMTMVPTNQLDQLSDEFVVKALNSKHLFDFDYEPNENDSLTIERVNRKELKFSEGFVGEYLRFKFSEGQWIIGQVNIFHYHLEVYKNGKVKISKTPR